MQRLQLRVAGVTFEGRGEKMKDILIGNVKGNPIHARLERELSNEKGTTAIAVYASAATVFHYIGYIPRIEASKIAPLMDQKHRVDVIDAIIIGGHE